MAQIKKSTILYINQVRQDNFEKLIGKGFSEAFHWHNYFKKVIFICYSTTRDFLFKKQYANCYLLGIPFDLSPSTFESIISLGKNYLRLFMYLYKLTKLINIDIIRLENLLLSGPSVYLISKLKKIPYIIWLGGFERKSFLTD